MVHTDIASDMRSTDSDVSTKNQVAVFNVLYLGSGFVLVSLYL